ncbi:MAG TPA: UbiA-like polyprenyltransferase [Chthoniobacterales bacterium]|nr:UbiA-like polyprenyltransferase [Chthoniobacterales bacterium]
MSQTMGPLSENAIARFLQFIRFSHTVFALPFALGALLVAARARPAWRTLVLVLLCMILARTAAMLFNRLADWSLDQRNPRTANRHRLASRSLATALLVICTLGFIAAASAINPATALLSPVALALVFFYSLTKHFTDGTHFFLGFALAIAPAGAWIAQTGSLALPPLVLGTGVLCWVAGFDLIYATQDYEFDRREGLRSLVVRLGIARALQLAQWLHLAMFGALLGFGLTAGLGLVYFCAMPLIAAALLYEHRSAARLDLAAINRAFFRSNAFVSALFLVAVWADLVLRS